MNSNDLQKLREEYTSNTLDESEVKDDPFNQFGIWFEEAVTSKVKEPNAMTLSTVDASHKPHNRIVLLKGFDKSGFTFFTNQASSKGDEIAVNPHVSLCFFWIELERQVRIEGVAEKISRVESEAYFKTRPHMSQIGALASNQSEVVENRDYLDKKFKDFADKYPEGKVPMPESWGGYKVVPNYFEFWQGRRSRLHDRITYERNETEWLIQRLSP